jgi:hypothetical protein
MSTDPKPAAPVPAMDPGDKELWIVSHSNLFYWWPVWLVGFILAGLTWIDGNRMAIVPTDSQVQLQGDRNVLTTPSNAPLYGLDADNKPYIKIHHDKSFGVIFAFVLLLVIFITNVPLRGLWSVVALVTLFFSVAIIILMNWHVAILEALGSLFIYINMAGYLLISIVLFVMWLLTFTFFDRQRYIVFSPGQFRVKQEIGGGEDTYDTIGMVVQKQRNDLFRHWILGLGSGDLVVKTSGAHAHQIDLPNVLFVGSKLKQIEDLMREKEIVRG